MTELEAKFNKANQLFEQKKYLHAIQLYKYFLDEPEFSRKALIRLTEIYDIQNQTEAAISLFEDYLEHHLDDDNLRTYFAQFLIRKSYYQEAHQILSGVSTKAQPEKNFLMGLVNYYLNDYDVAQINFQEFVKQNPKSDLLPEAFHYLSKCHIELKFFDAALKYTETALKLDSQNPYLFKTRALIYYQKEMYFHAAESIKKAQTLNPLDYELLKIAAKIFFKLGEYDKAQRDLRLYLDKTEPDSEALALMGIILKELKNFKDALAYFELTLKLNSSNELAKKELDDCKEKLSEGS